MIPHTYPSILNTATNSREMVVKFLTSVTGLHRWVDYIPVSYVAAYAREGSYDNNGFIPIRLVDEGGYVKTPFLDYVPVFLDTAATDTWQVNAVGYIPVGTSRTREETALRTRLALDGLTVADYDASFGVTGALNASAWANQIGAAGPLLQATGANQPIVLPYSGEKYAYLPGVAANDLTTPNAAANQIVGDIEIIAYVSLNDVTAASQTIVSKRSTAEGMSWHLGTDTGAGGIIRLYAKVAGVDKYSEPASTTLGMTNGQFKWVKATRVAATGVYAYFSSSDGVTWTAAGGGTGTSGALTDTGAIVRIGAVLETQNLLSGKVARLKISPTIGGTASVDFNAADWSETSTNAATQTSSTTGEVWTLNNTGAKLAQIVGSAQMLFDGTAGYMKAAFTLAQPTTVYLVGKQITWVDNRYLIDGLTGSRSVIRQTVSTPRLGLYAGAALDTVSGWAVGAAGVITAVFNGASSSLQVDGNAPLSGNAGTQSANGLTVGALPTPSNYSNIQVKRVILRAAADSAATQAQIQALLKSIYGTP